jgi:serine/threonine protein kinase
MERPLWDRIQEIYYSALLLAPSERRAFVESACAGDTHLLREVNSLLDADEAGGKFLESSLFEVGLKLITSGDSSGAGNGHDSSRDNLIGTIIEHYLIEKKLGQGGMGTVYLALDTRLHHMRVVIKILVEASLHNPYLMQKSKQEVEALARLDHPNVVRVVDRGNLGDGKPYLVMEYVEGLTLRSQIPNDGMNLGRAASILKQIGRALDYAHRKGILHRDLKPENIILRQLNGTDFVKIVDFGIAKVKDSVVAPGTVDSIPIGTAQYMSPEHLLGVQNLTPASDVYSMAVMAYEMVTGRRPFNASPAQLLELHREGVRVNPVDLRANLSTEAQAIILRGLSFKPGARYQNAAEFGDSLAHALTNEEAGDPLINPGAGHGRQWGKWFVLGGSLAVLICVAVLIAVSLRNRGNAGEIQTLSATPTSTPSPSTHSVVYWLTVQKIRNGRPYEPSYQSTGVGVFETGYKFRLNVSCPETGYVYLFNEGTPEPNRTSFTIIYPTPAMNNGSASVGADQTLETNWNTFSGRPGTENFWIVWSTLPVPELEAAKPEAFKHQDGGLTGENLDAVKKFLTTKEDETRVKTSRDKQSNRTTLRGPGDLLVKLVKFEHR